MSHYYLKCVIIEALNKKDLLINTQLYIHAELYPSGCGWITELPLSPEQIAVGKSVILNSS